MVFCKFVLTINKKENTIHFRAKQTYCQRFQPRKAIRTSLNPHMRHTQDFKKPLYSHTSCEILDIPLYAISRLKKELDC